jgi:hypothetical protein
MNGRAIHGCLLMLPLLACWVGCADDTFAVVSVSTTSGSLDDVAQLRVHVTNADAEDVLFYPKQMSSPLHLDTGRPITFSVEFKGWSGQAMFEVEPLAKDGIPLAYGRAKVFVTRHALTAVVVSVYPGTTRPESRQGGAMSDEGLACAPNAPAEACGAGNRTCGILCSTDDSPAVSMCYVAGSGGPGQVCGSNRDCAPGSQCFTLGAAGCRVMTCLKFCGSDAECGDVNSFCNLPIPCGDKTFLACSRPCDPTVSSNNGCAPGLGCFVYAGESTDCACPGPGGAGATCTQNAGCAAGLSCFIPTGADAGSGTGVCRMVCKLDAPACPSGTSCHAFDNSSRRLYGICQ